MDEITGKDWITGPLWEEFYLILGIRHDKDNVSALALYERVEDLLHTSLRSRELRNRLSPSQYNSLRIIREWWDCSIEEDEWFASTTDRKKHLDVLYSFPIVDQAPPLVVQMFFGIGPAVPQISTYRLEVYRLFQMEFDSCDHGTQDRATHLGFLQQQRERAAFYSSVQRTTFAYRSKTDTPGSQSDPQGHIQSDVLELQMKNLDLDPPIGACIEACPWLNFRKRRTGRPFFLWDTHSERSIVVDEMDTNPEYICISHTWGRWCDPETSPTLVSGVPWLVPQNTLFDVQELPQRLKIAFPRKYIWMDLLCIPQDGSERALIEIGRQADIFGNAIAAVAWLNDIESWTGLRQTTEWLCRYCLSSYGDFEQPLPDVDVSQSTGLVIPDSEDDDHARIPGSWFTSLWTLQEACLRPDMLFCNRNFDIFGIGEGFTTLVSLDSLAALLNFVIHQYYQGPFEMILNSESPQENMRSGTIHEYDEVNKAAPKRKRRILEKLPKDVLGVQELYDALVMSGMNKLFKASPAFILNLGQHRQCTSQRAEAIMSVIGATDWYTTHVDRYKTSPSEDSLVSGYYPIAFLDEVKKKLGAQFFAIVSSNLGFLQGVVDMREDHWTPLNDSTGVGSLLPCISSQTSLVMPEHESGSTRDHPSVEKWMILPNGAVKIQEVGILSSSGENFKSKLQASILVPGIYSTTAQQQVDLHDWIRNFRVGSHAANFAVSLYQATKKFQWGLILKEVGPCHLVKIGTFFTDGLAVEEVPSQTVDWIVL